MFKKTSDEILRTKNSLEAWHCSFKAHIFYCYPIFQKFLNIPRDEDNLVFIIITAEKIKFSVMDLMSKYERTTV